MTTLEKLKQLHEYNNGTAKDSIDEAYINLLSAELVDEILPRLIAALEWVEKYAKMDDRDFIDINTDIYRKIHRGNGFAKELLDKLEGK
jgi:hypothetical protein